MFVLACFTENESSSLTLGNRFYVWAIIADSISLRDEISWSLRSQVSSWWWPHWAWKASSIGLLKANNMQWSATIEPWHACTYNTHKTNYTRQLTRPHAMLICFDGPGCHVINIHEKSSHCETLKSNRKKRNKFFTNICDLKENYRTTFYLTKNSARLRLKLTSLVKGYFRSHECMSLFGREPPSTNVYSGLRTVNMFENVI